MRTVHLPPSARKQRGAALLLFVIALVLAASYALLKKVNQAPNDASRDTYTMQQLNQARAAVLGYALSNTIQPGRLPCPDYMLDGNLDGDSDTCVPVGGYVQPGRLPWRTLGLAELRDADNEPLWYVPAIGFDGSQPINSSANDPALRINAGATPLVAIVLSPGAVLGTQTRLPGNPAAQLDPARYFEDVNALGATAYVTAPASSSTPFNDRLLAIRMDRFMPELERRVLRELAGLLGPGPYPNPAAVGTTTCNKAIPEGLVPIDPDPPNCDIVLLPTFPNWFRNDWQALIWYVMDPLSNLNVRLAGGVISPNLQTLLFSPGGPIPALGQPTPRSPAPPAPPPTVLDLLDEAENTDGGPLYYEPVNSAVNNDQLLIVAP